VTSRTRSARESRPRISLPPPAWMSSLERARRLRSPSGAGLTATRGGGVAAQRPRRMGDPFAAKGPRAGCVAARPEDPTERTCPSEPARSTGSPIESPEPLGRRARSRRGQPEWPTRGPGGFSSRGRTPDGVISPPGSQRGGGRRDQLLGAVRKRHAKWDILIQDPVSRVRDPGSGVSSEAGVNHPSICPTSRTAWVSHVVVSRGRRCSVDRWRQRLEPEVAVGGGVGGG